jgi:hypothetical protein
MTVDGNVGLHYAEDGSCRETVTLLRFLYPDGCNHKVLYLHHHDGIRNL